MGLKIKHLVYLSLSIAILFALSIGCSAQGITVKDREIPFVLVQDTDALKNSNGKIIEQIQVTLKSQWSGAIDCYKIKYLSDGLKVIGFVLKPKGESSKFPVIIYNRGGNREFGKISETTLEYLAYLTSQNYVVLASQYRGNDGGEGREGFGGKDINDVLNLMPLARSLSFTDTSRIFMLGYSRGGMMTYIAIKDGVDIRAAAVVGGITDLDQTYHERELPMQSVISELVGFDKNEWKNRSAYYWPEKIDIPVLILHGGADWRVRVSQAKKLAEKLQALGKTHELVIFYNGDHGLTTHRAERDRKILEWFAKYAK